MHNKHLSKLTPFLRYEIVQKLMGKCPLCHFEYKTLQAKIIDENRDAQLMYIKCQKCHSAILVLIITSGPFISSLCFVTDLNDDDLLSLKNNKKINDEDLLDFYQLFKDKNFCHNFLQKNNLTLNSK